MGFQVALEVFSGRARICLREHRRRGFKWAALDESRRDRAGSDPVQPQGWDELPSLTSPDTVRKTHPQNSSQRVDSTRSIVFSSILRPAFVDGLPVLYDRRHISVPAISILPSPRVDIFSPSEEASKKRDSLSGPLLLYPWVAPARRFWLEVDSLAPVAESECCEPPEAAAGEHSPRGGEHFPGQEVRMEESLNRSRSYRVHRSVRCASTSSTNF